MIVFFVVQCGRYKCNAKLCFGKGKSWIHAMIPMLHRCNRGERGKNNRRKEITHSSALHTYPTLSSEYPGMRRCLGHLLIMTLTTSIPPACNRLVISRDYFIRLCREQGRTLLYLLSGHRERDTLAGLDLGLDEGPDGVNGEEHEDDENETEKGGRRWGGPIRHRWS